MANNKLFSRRNFVKSSIASVGAGVIGNASVYAADCPVDTIETPGAIPLNDILSDYLQVTRSPFVTKKAGRVKG